MKTLKKMMALMIAMVMVLGMSVSVFAQTVGGVQAQTGKGQITITNASKGETYKVIKLFDASVTGTADGSVRYTGTIPEALGTYYVQDAAGNISATKAAYSTITYYTDASKTNEADTETNYWTGEGMSVGLKAALKTYADDDDDAGTVSDGSTLQFNNLDYGYYIVCTTQGEGIVTVDTTNPTATVNDKNTTLPVKELKKSADDKDVAIGDTVTYTVTFDTANYSGAGAEAKQIIEYVVKDALPASLTPIVNPAPVIKVGNDIVEYTGNLFGDGAVITWATVDEGSAPATYTSKYDNGSTITVTYSATVNEEAANETDGAITNTVEIDYKDATGASIPVGPTSTTETIYTYALQITKKDGEGNQLTGAEFKLFDQATEGNQIYVTGTNGAYIVTTEANDVLIEAGTATITGLDADVTYYLEEVTAPDGYNKLTSRQEVTATAATETTVTYSPAGETYDPEATYYKQVDEEYIEQPIADESAFNAIKDYVVLFIKITTTTSTGEFEGFPEVEVINQAGVELPATGGIGTTIFYIVGTILVIGAGVVLVTRKRMAAR